MANDNPDGLELYLHMLRDLVPNKAEVNSMWVEETNSTVCFWGLFWQTRKKSKETPREVWLTGWCGRHTFCTLVQIMGKEKCTLPETARLCFAWRHLSRAGFSPGRGLCSAVTSWSPNPECSPVCWGCRLSWFKWLSGALWLPGIVTLLCSSLWEELGILLTLLWFALMGPILVHGILGPVTALSILKVFLLIHFTELGPQLGYNDMQKYFWSYTFTFEVITAGARLTWMFAP